MIHVSEFIHLQELQGSFCIYSLFLFKSSIAHWAVCSWKRVEPLPVFFWDRMKRDFSLSYKKQMRMPRSCADFPTTASLLLGEKMEQAALSNARCFTEGFWGHLCMRLTFKKSKMKCCGQRDNSLFFVATVPPPHVLSSKQKWSCTWNFVNASFTSSNCWWQKAGAVVSVLRAEKPKWHQTHFTSGINTGSTEKLF